MHRNPAVTFQREVQWFEPVLLTAGAVLRLAARPPILRAVLSTLARLQPDDYLVFVTEYMSRGTERFGESWGYADLLTVLQAAASVLEPEAYLEIGVRRGRSLSVVAAACPTADLYGFDLWIPNYAGMPNPGPEFVRGELSRVGHRGRATLVTGESQQSVPAFLADHPELYFDLITVDGDHAAPSAAQDLRNVLPRLKLGGVVVLDDIAHPQHPELAGCWEEVVASDRSFDTALYSELGYGVAVGVRRRSEP
jgi:predicted O-methyltransferase YrrM